MHLWTALGLGLAGSLHCVGMCGPLALALPVPPGGGFRFFVGRLFYNLGRVVTYALLGVAFGFLGQTLARAGFQQWVSLALGLMLLAGLFLTPRFAAMAPVTRLVGRLKQAMGRFLRTRSLSALAVLGLLNGLLPCGLVYVAAAAAASTGGTVSGALYMVVFGLGTVPMMLALSLSGRLLQGTLRRQLTRAVPVAVTAVALLLVLRGLGLGIPYLSPNLGGSSAAACCHPAPGQPVDPMAEETH